MKNVFAQNIQNRFDLVVGLTISRGHDVEKAIFGVSWRASQGSVDHTGPFLGKISADLAGGGWNGGSKINDRCPFFDPRQDPVVSIDQTFNHIRGGHAEHHDVAGFGEVFGGFHLNRSSRNCCCNRLFVAAHHHKVKAFVLQALGHVASHLAKANETDCRLCHVLTSNSSWIILKNASTPAWATS